MSKYRVLVIADLHCGHHVGLTPPDWDSRPGDGWGPKAEQLWKMRRVNWKWYAQQCEELKPDMVIVNADCIDGKGKRSGGTEQLTADRNEQCDMAAACIQETGAKRIVMSYGTAYHTGYDEDWEDQVATLVNAESIGGEDDIKVYGNVINYRHFAGGSAIPHGRGTALSKERLWNVLWSERGEYPKADIILRSHRHYFTYIGEADWLSVSTPALQGYGSKFGARVMSNTVDFGICWFDFSEDGEWGWDYRVKRLRRKHAFAAEV